MPLPPLNAIKAFGAAGRLENFSKAAAELNVTPGAVSRQIKNLEQHLGVDLFARVGNEVHPAGCFAGSSDTIPATRCLPADSRTHIPAVPATALTLRWELNGPDSIHRPPTRLPL